jgi:glutamate synthase domain-containing protein 2
LGLIHEASRWDDFSVEDVRVKARIGRYRIRGFSSFQEVPHFDDIVFLPSAFNGIIRKHESCTTKTVLGTRHAKEPLVLDIPIYITGMSYGALSRNAKVALGIGATKMGTATCTGDGGLLMDERRASKKLIYEILPSRYGLDPHHLLMAEALEVVVGQGAKPGTGGLLMGQKVSEVIARARELPIGVDQRSPTRHPEWLGPDDLSIFIETLREVTDWRVPVHIKLGACRVKDDVKLAVKVGADGVVVDGMQAGTGASAEILLDHSGIPTMPAITLARQALEELGVYGKVYLVASGGIRNGVDAAKALALGADAVAIGQAALISLNCNRELPGVTDFQKEVGLPAGYCNKCHSGKCPVGITTQDPELESRLDPQEAGNRVANFLSSMAEEIRMITLALGYNDVHDLERSDLGALTPEASAMTQLPLVGPNRPFGW